MGKRGSVLVSTLLFGLIATIAGCSSGGSGANPGTGTDAGAPDVASDAPGVPLPLLSSSDPADGAHDVPRTAWLVLAFDDVPDAAALGSVKLDCGAGTPEIDVDPLDKRVVVNPRAELPAGGDCTLAWPGPDGAKSIEFGVAAKGDPAILAYDREDKSLIAPFPDDYFLDEDASTATGHRFVAPVPDRPKDVKTIFADLMAGMKDLDGFSPLAPIVVPVPDALDLKSLPTDETASIDPLATIGLFDVDSSSPDYGKRVAFNLVVKEEVNKDGTPAHTLVIFPSAGLEPRGSYALIVTRRALVDATRPLEPTGFMRGVMAGDASTSERSRAALRIGDLMSALQGGSPPVRPDDIALALRVSVRSVDHLPDDLVSIRKQLQSLPAPTFTIDKVEADTTDPGVAAVVTGTWTAPSFRDGDFMHRDANGKPTPNGTFTTGFTLALPEAAANGPVPIVMYQHGQPGHADGEVQWAAGKGLADAGFALVGFTDIADREYTMGKADGLATFSQKVFSTVVFQQRLPDWVMELDTAEQLAFLRLIPKLSSVDVWPLGAPDGTPELDPSAPLGYLGISHGSSHGVGLLAFAPEIHAAALVVGGGRFSAQLVQQEEGSKLLPALHLYDAVTGLFSDVSRGEFWTGISCFQASIDYQDWEMMARFAFREPLDLGDSRRASVLFTEGLGDTLVPVYATRGAAWELGLSHVGPVQQPVPFLDPASAPLSGNRDADTTLAFYQYVAKDYVGATPTPGCVTDNLDSGHHCAQSAAEAIAQRVHFFKTALSGTPEVIDPLSP